MWGESGIQELSDCRVYIQLNYHRVAWLVTAVNGFNVSVN